MVLYDYKNKYFQKFILKFQKKRKMIGIQKMRNLNFHSFGIRSHIRLHFRDILFNFGPVINNHQQNIFDIFYVYVFTTPKNYLKCFM